MIISHINVVQQFIWMVYTFEYDISNNASNDTCSSCNLCNHFYVKLIEWKNAIFCKTKNYQEWALWEY